MHIEILAGGLGGAAAIGGFTNHVSDFLDDTEKLISSFKTVKNETYRLSGDVGTLQGALDDLDFRIRDEEEKQTQARGVEQKSNDFLSLAARVDSQVGIMVDQNKDEFYRIHSWLKPPADTDAKPWYEQAWETLCGIGDAVAEGAKNAWDWVKGTAKKAWDGLVAFYNEHKKIIDTVLIIVGAALTIAAVIASGGVALTGLVPLLTTLGFSAGTAATISSAIAITAIASTCLSGVMDIVDIWCEIDNPVFNALQTTSHVISTASTFVYTVGSGISKQIQTSKKPLQEHHFATNKGVSQTYKDEYAKILNKYDLELDQPWNKAMIRHQGRHPIKYHNFVLKNMQRIDSIARGNPTLFKSLYTISVKLPVMLNPTMLYNTYWKAGKHSILKFFGGTVFKAISKP